MTLNLPPEDVLAIRRLYAEYNSAIHRGDAGAWARCFTQDGVFSNRARTVSGAAALLEYAAGWIGEGGARYWIDNLVLEATGAGATGTCYLIIFKVSAGQPAEVRLTGIYTDSLAKVEGAWKFASRRIARDE